ncbi:MAG: CBS domain-containing protein [Alphaproteobacteria bacterium]|jgi:CBS domain-containing protein|nr:CBS domain-containing protein [Alphaproteobacteria bacterium]MDP6813851.1 CBS domain-containing protein [Alphaproteobacteria bacterium]
MQVQRILDDKGGEVIAVAPDTTVASVAKTLDENRIGAILVRDQDGFIKGVVSERDIVRALARSGDGCLTMSVSELMTRDVVFCDPGDSIDEVMAVMTDRRIRHLPVMQDNHLIGIISIGDVVKHRIEAIEKEAAAMRDYIATG